MGFKLHTVWRSQWFGNVLLLLQRAREDLRGLEKAVQQDLSQDASGPCHKRGAWIKNWRMYYIYFFFFRPDFSQALPAAEEAQGSTTGSMTGETGPHTLQTTKISHGRSRVKRWL